MHPCAVDVEWGLSEEMLAHFIDLVIVVCKPHGPKPLVVRHRVGCPYHVSSSFALAVVEFTLGSMSGIYEGRE